MESTLRALSLSPSSSSSQDMAGPSSQGPARRPYSEAALWMILDGLTILLSAAIATLYVTHAGPLQGIRGFLHGTLIYGRSMWILLAFLCGFCISLIVTSRRLKLYSPMRLNNILQEQALSIRACFTAGLLLTGTLYLIKAEDISRRIVLITLWLVMTSLSLRRLVYRLTLYRSFERGADTRNVLIVGTGQEAEALRQHLQSVRHLGYTFRGLVEVPDLTSEQAATSTLGPDAVEALFQHVRKHFIDEVFLTGPCERTVVQRMLQQARTYRVNLRIVPEMYDGQALRNPVEYIGEFPTIPLHRGTLPEFSLGVKRILDVMLSIPALLLLSPLFAAISVAVKLDSDGPVFYCAERIGKKGRVFRCFKFRTMVRDADTRRAAMMHLNERDGVLFKVTKDPRVTKVGQFLRKYSLDELPQFLNVLRGEMSIVGPRPPIASEVQRYELNHLRRLDVMPGITGLWQIQARQDPSFDRYISMDVAYIENWSIMLDLKIIVQTVGVVLNGSGS